MRQPGDRSPAPAPLVPAQDLANTADLEAGQDELQTVDDARRYAAEHGLTGLSFTETDVAELRELREAIRDVCLAHTGTELSADSAATLDRLLRRAPLRLVVDQTGEATVAPAEGLDGAAAVTAYLAAGIVRAVADRTWARLKACDAHQCRWVYYDRSPAGRSRWCTMSICGSRAKMRAYRQRAAGTDSSRS